MFCQHGNAIIRNNGNHFYWIPITEEKWSLKSDKKKNECCSIKAVHLFKYQKNMAGEERKGKW